MIKKLPDEERTVFNLCANGANDEIHLAKCLAALFQVRDEFERKNENENNSETVSPSENILSRFLRTMLSTILPLFQNLDVPNIHSNINKSIRSIKIFILKTHC